MPAIDLALIIIRKWEGCRLSPYLDAVGVPTIGYGSTRYEDGTAVTLTDPPITHERAIALLEHTVARTYLPGTMTLCPPLVDRRAAAITSFSYNEGLGRLKSSTLRRKVNAGQYDQVPAELAKWCMAGGRKLPGLVARRADEARLFQV